MKLKRAFMTILACLLCYTTWIGPAEVAMASESDPVQKQESLFRHAETLTGIPWYFLAAINQYERNVRNSRHDLPDASSDERIAIRPSNDWWVGKLNPDTEDTNPLTIQLFGGLGKDGNEDGQADRDQGEDALWSLIRYLQPYGTDWLSLKTAIWHLYRNPTAVDVISHIAQIYAEFETMALDRHYFPVSLRHIYTYRNTWGASRSYGGRRIHEGTDIFAHHGTPVYSTSYGYVEIKGWNRYGGWRIGIRDLHNNYHYYAHLGNYNKDMDVGSIVEPGDLLGHVGNSGYGPPGTAGKFPPHLHYGMYKFSGESQWSFDPYPYLRKWEQETRKQN